MENGTSSFFKKVKWTYTINDGDILIQEIVAKSLWEQMQNSYKHTYKVKTFSLDMLKEAINDYGKPRKGYPSNYLKTNKIRRK